MIIWHQQDTYPTLNRAQDYTLAYREYLIFIVLLLVGFVAAQHVRAVHVTERAYGVSSVAVAMVPCAAQTGGCQ